MTRRLAALALLLVGLAGTPAVAANQLVVRFSFAGRAWVYRRDVSDDPGTYRLDDGTVNWARGLIHTAGGPNARRVRSRDELRIGSVRVFGTRAQAETHYRTCLRSGDGPWTGGASTPDPHPRPPPGTEVRPPMQSIFDGEHRVTDYVDVQVGRRIIDDHCLVVGQARDPNPSGSPADFDFTWRDGASDYRGSSLRIELGDRAMTYDLTLTVENQTNGAMGYWRGQVTVPARTGGGASPVPNPGPTPNPTPGTYRSGSGQNPLGDLETAIDRILRGLRADPGLPEAAIAAAVAAAVAQLLAGMGFAAAMAAAQSTAQAAATATGDGNGVTISSPPATPGTRELTGDAARAWLFDHGFIAKGGRFLTPYRDWENLLPSQANRTALLHIQYGANTGDHVPDDVPLRIMVRDGDEPRHDPDPDPVRPEDQPPTEPDPPPPPPAQPPVAPPRQPGSEPPTQPPPEEQPPTWEEVVEKKRREILRLRHRRDTLQDLVRQRARDKARFDSQHEAACRDGFKDGVVDVVWFAITNLNLLAKLEKFGRVGRFLQRWGGDWSHGYGRAFVRYLAENLINTAIKRGGSRLTGAQRAQILDEAQSAAESAGVKSGVTETVRHVVNRTGRAIANCQQGGDGVIRRFGNTIKGGSGGTADGFGAVVDGYGVYANWQENADRAAAIRGDSSRAQQQLAELRSELETVSQDLAVEEKVWGADTGLTP